GRDKCGFIQYQVIRWCNNNRCVGVKAFDLKTTVGNTGGSVAHNRLGQYLVVAHIRYLLLYQFGVVLIGDDVNIFFRANLKESLVCILYEGFAGTKYIQELFRVRCSANRPKTASDATGHNDSIVIFVHLYFKEL